MAKYLYFDGTGGRLQLPSMTFTEIVLDMSAIRTTDAIKIYVDARSGVGFCYFQSNTNGTDSWSSFNNVYVDGINKSNNTIMIPNNQRCSVRLVRAVGTDDLTIFSNNAGGAAFVKGNIYDVKIYNGTTLVAHYDMTTGTAQDQSGNGRHATLYGGTWLDDGTGGTPTGEDGSALFSLSQKIYSDESILTSTNQKIYSDDNVSNSTRQTIYSDELLNIDSKQIIYEDSDLSFATLQEIFNDGQMGSVIYPFLLQIYSDEVVNLSTNQSIFESGVNQYSTNQAIYENNQLQNSTKQIIYSDSFTQYDSTQKIYSDSSSGYVTKQSIYDTNSFTLSTIQQLFEHSSMDLQTKQSIYQLDTLELLTLQSIYEDNSVSMDTLQQFLSDYVEYNQVFKYLLGINRYSNFELGIVGNQKFGVDISDRVIKYDLNVSDQVKKYDLNI